MKKTFILIFLGLWAISIGVVAQDAATLYERANNQYNLYQNERSRGNSSATMYKHLYACYELYVKVLESPNNKAQLTGAKNRLFGIYNDLMNGAIYFLNNKQPDFLDFATAYIELPRMQVLRSDYGRFVQNEQYPQLLFQTARGYKELKKYPQAIKYFKEFKGTNPSAEMLRDTYVLLNEAYREQKDYTQQELILKEAIGAFPHVADFPKFLYNLYGRINNEEKMLEAADCILKLEPNNVQVLTAKAFLLMKQQKYEDALTIYERLYKLEPNNLKVWEGLAKTNHNIGSKIISNSINATDKATEARERQRGQDYMEEAAVFFLKVLEKDPVDKQMMQGLVNAYLHGGQIAEANVLSAMLQEGASFDNFPARLAAYNEVHGQEATALGHEEFVASNVVVPARLIIENCRLTDGNGMDIQMIEAGKRFKIEFTVRNEGEGEAYNVRSSLLEQQGNEYLFEGARVRDEGHIKPGTSKTCVFDFIASTDMPSFLANIEIRATEQNGFDADPFTLKVNASALAIPRLHVATHLFSATEGSAITKNSSGKLKLAVQNVGAKTARDVKLKFTWPADVHGNLEMRIDSILPGKYKEVNVDFSVTNRFAGDSIIVILAANDGERISSLDETFKYKLGEYLYRGGMVDLASEFDSNVNVEDVVLREDNELLENIPVGGKNPHRYALIIGNEDYTAAGASAEANVPFAFRDAVVFREYCTRTFGVPDNHIQFYKDATTGKMREAIDWLINVGSANPDAEIIFYYSGHGSNDEETREAYLLPTDLTGKNVTYGYSLSELYKRLGELRVKGAYVFLDACFSGSSKSEKPLIALKGVSREANFTAPYGHTLSFSSSSGTQTSNVYNEKKQGYYTYFLLKTLQEADGNLTLYDWFVQTARKVNAATSEIGKQQTPKIMPSEDWDWKHIQLKTTP